MPAFFNKKIHLLCSVLVFISMALMPFGAFVHASSTDMHHPIMEMDCEEDDCNGMAHQERCLEHCLQKDSVKRLNLATSQNRIEAPIACICEKRTVFSDTKDGLSVPNSTGPPIDRGKTHLCIQKKE